MESRKRRRVEERKREREDVAREGEAISPSGDEERSGAGELPSRRK